MDEEQGERPTVPLRIRLDFGYDGTDFSGWAAQPGLRTVEGTLSAALTTILRAEEPVRLTVAGRTDAGVHARGQVAHLDPDPAAWALLPGRSTRTPEDAALSRLRGILPADIGMRAVAVAAEGFEARFAALQRRYLYRLADRPELADPLRRRETVIIKRPLDVDAMHAAAQKLLGLNDFGAFCKKREGATTVLLAAAVSVAAQKTTEVHPGKGGSPHVRTEWTIDGANISVEYGRPSLKGRPEADLMPVGQPWRTGADEATVLKTDKPLKFGTLSLQPGTYTLNTQPGDKDWQLIVGKLGKPGQWGVPYMEALEIGRAPMSLQKTKAPVEQVTISVDDTPKGGALKVEWGTRSASIPFTVR